MTYQVFRHLLAALNETLDSQTYLDKKKNMYLGALEAQALLDLLADLRMNTKI